MRAIWTMALAVLIGLVLAGLIDATWYTANGAAFWLAAGTLVMVIALLILAGHGKPDVPRPVELVGIGLAGLVLTTLFWFRARAGLAGGWGAGIELSLLALFGWAWPALLLVIFYRRSGEGWRPDNRRRFVWLSGTALLAGAFGWVFHLALWDWYETAGHHRSADHPLAIHSIVKRPGETPLALTVLGSPWQLQASPAAVIASHPADPDRPPFELAISGRVFPGITRQLSWQIQGSQVSSSDPRVIRASTSDDGRWQLHPGLPGPAVVTVTNRRAQTHVGVWVTNRHGQYQPFEVVTDRLTIEPVAASMRDGEFLYRQTLELRNRSNKPLLGPVYAVFRTDAHDRVVLSSGRRTARIEPPGLPWVEALPATPGNRAPVLAPGESVEFEILVFPELTREWLHFNVDLVQALDPL